MENMLMFKAKLCAFLVATSLALPVWSAEIAQARHKLALQVNSADETVHNIALNNAVNAQEALGIDNVVIEVVVYGPGMSLLTGKSAESARVSSLAMQNITFSACQKTLDKIAEKNDGKAPALLEGVGIVPAGVVRLMELQEAGYSYVKP
jgi:uncharacterized protein